MRSLSIAANLLILLRQCRGRRDKTRFCRYVAANALTRLSHAQQTNGASGGDDELFLRFKHADLWFGSAPGTHELSPYLEIFVRGEYDDDNLRLAGRDAILDVGANIGLFALRCASRFPGHRIFSFEPHPAAYRRLVMNLAANQVCGAVPINAAVSSNPGWVPFFAGGSTVAGSIFGTARQPVPAFHVRAVALDPFCRMHAIDSIGLLKVDVEGAEVAVLQGAREALEITRCVMVECHSPQLESAVRSILADAGFDAAVKRDFRYGARVLHFSRRAPSHDNGSVGERN